MIKSILLTFTMLLVFTFSKAQPAMQLNGLDCNGVSHDLLADLDAGKAVLLHFFMTNCGSCAPPAQVIQEMANNIMTLYPGMITGYAMPYNNATSCTHTSVWCSSNGLSLYMPYDSGATQVAYYGGFGMPTVVLLGGADHRVMFSTLSFATSDTTLMRDSILNLFSGAAALNDLEAAGPVFNVYPNPANEIITVKVDIKESSNILIDITDITGRQVAIIAQEEQKGIVTKQFNTAILPNGNYLVRLLINGNTTTEKLTVVHK